MYGILDRIVNLLGFGLEKDFHFFSEDEEEI